MKHLHRRSQDSFNSLPRPEKILMRWNPAIGIYCEGCRAETEIPTSESSTKAAAMRRRMKTPTDILLCAVVSLASFAVYWTAISVNEIMHRHSGGRHPAGAETSAAGAATAGPTYSAGPLPSPSIPDSQETPQSSYQQQPDASSAGANATLADLNRTDQSGTDLTSDGLVPGDINPGVVALWRFDLRPANPAGTDLSNAELRGAILEGGHPTDIWGAAYLNSEGARHEGDWKRAGDWDDGFQRMKDPLSLDPVPTVPTLKVPPFQPPFEVPDVQMSAPR